MKLMLRKIPALRPVRRIVLLAAAILTGLLIIKGGPWVQAQIGGGYDLTWWTIDGGGATPITGGPYTLLSSSGQPYASSNMSSGPYTLQSGFWPNANTTFNVYLPMVTRLGNDLTGSFTLSPAGSTFSAGQPVTINVTVTNHGNEAVDGFWVDFYINPASTPVVNKSWYNLCAMSPCYGLAWYVTGLGPGQSVNLSSNPGSYKSDHSSWPGHFAAGTTTLHLLVDSWNPGMANGAVTEWNEQNNLYTLPTGVVVSGLEASSQEAPPPLPDRPARPAE